MNRAEAIELVDQTHDQFAEMLRVGSCPVCEALMKVTPATAEETPASLHDFRGRTPDSYGEWTSRHDPNCRLILELRNVATIQRIFGIRSEWVKELVVLPDGSARAFLRQIRIPDPE